MAKKVLEMNGDYRFERISSNHFSDLQGLFRAAFKIDISIEYLFKKFSTEVFGTSYIGYIAYSSEHEPSAFYGVYPCLVESEGNTYLIAQSGDTMTHPDHQGKGLFTQLALQTYELCKSEGIHFVFGFPNQHSYPGFVKKLGWTHFDNLEAYEIRVKTLPWVRIQRLFRLPQWVHDMWCSIVFSLLKKGTAFSSSQREIGKGVVCHTKGFDQYKVYGKGQLKRISTTNFWISHDEMFLLLGDISAFTEKEFLAGISRLKRIAFFCGLPHIRCHVSTETMLQYWFKQYGKKMDTTYPVGGINFTNKIPFNSLKFTTLDNDTF
jgi:hypothetical protein